MATRTVYLVFYVVIGVVLLVPRFIRATLSVDDLKAFDDSILFDIDWPGEDLGFVGVPSILLTTERLEKYKCLVPRFRNKGSDLSLRYTGPSPYELMQPFLSGYSGCSYLRESYWTYELCHGKYVRQYREDRAGKDVLVQQYFLGIWDKDEASNLEKELQREEEEGEKESNVRSKTPSKKVYGLGRRYIQLNMTGGTMCNLNNKPRSTKVLYVCFEYGNQQIYSLKETSTCEYEIIVLSRVLCSHPKYEPQTASDYVVSCHSVGNAPKVPKSLVEMDKERYRLRQEAIQKSLEIFSVEEFQKVEDSKDLSSLESEEQTTLVVVADKTSSPTDTPPDDDFLSGKSCLYGGSGWWKYKFCHGKTVDQYRVEKDLRLTVIHLGKFIKTKHLKWLEQNPNKRPKKVEIRKSISHFYSEGKFCEINGRPRQTEVRIKCLDRISRPSEVGLYLLEPRPCEYILGVESHLVCEYVKLADENGLVMSGGSGEEQEDVISLLDNSKLGAEEDKEEDVDEKAAIINGDD